MTVSMSTEWFRYTKFTIDGATGGADVGFRVFGTTHLLELLALFGVCLLTGLFYRKAGETARRRILLTVALLCLADEAAKDIFLLVTDQFRWDFLPLHLCSINIFVVLIYALRPSSFPAEWLYAVCLPGALIASLSPSWTKLPFLNFMHLHSYTVHALLLLFPLLLLFGGFRPNPRRLPLCGIALVGLCIPVFFLNRLLGTDFFFLNGTDGNAVLGIFESLFSGLGEYGYLLGLPILLTVLWTVLYLPWGIAEKIEKKRTEGQ